MLLTTCILDSSGTEMYDVGCIMHLLSLTASVLEVNIEDTREKVGKCRVQTLGFISFKSTVASSLFFILYRHILSIFLYSACHLNPT